MHLLQASKDIKDMIVRKKLTFTAFFQHVAQWVVLLPHSSNVPSLFLSLRYYLTDSFACSHCIWEGLLYILFFSYQLPKTFQLVNWLCRITPRCEWVHECVHMVSCKGLASHPRMIQHDPDQAKRVTEDERMKEFIISLRDCEWAFFLTNQPQLLFLFLFFFFRKMATWSDLKYTIYPMLQTPFLTSGILAI